MQPKLVSIVEAAKQLGVSRTTLYKLVSAGKLRTVHVGRRALVSNGAQYCPPIGVRS